MSEHTLLDAALAYAARGWLVFPCHTPTDNGCSCRETACANVGKHPRTLHGLHDATCDTGLIRKWWTMWPHANLAIRTGAVSGLVVLDIDSDKGGNDSVSDLEHAYSTLPHTLLQLTGGGGAHYFFTHPGTAVKNGVETLGDGLDIRGDGGYVIAPPSLHVSGKRYTWDVIHEPEDTPLAPMPAWLLALCQESARRDAPDAGAPIPQGNRNDTLFRLGCSLRARGCTEAVILAALREMNITQCQPPLTEEEIWTLAASCAKYNPGTSQEDISQRRNGPGAGTEVAPADAQEPRLPLSNTSNAQALLQAHGANLHYVYDWKSWLVWTNTHWERDTSGAVLRAAKQTVKTMLRQVERLDEKAAVDALMRHVKSSLATTQLKAMVENAQSEPGVAVTPDALDTHAWLLNCPNGTLDLRTGALLSHDRMHLLTKCLDVLFDPDATCPTWMAFLEHILQHNAELIVFLQRVLGYALTGATSEQCFFLLHGSGANGKSTFLEVLQALLGDYAQSTPSASLLAKDRYDGIPNDIARLRGARVVTAVEIGEGRRLNEELVKRLTGQDKMTARFLRAEYFDFLPEFKLFVACNHLPTIRGTDHAIWRRIKCIPFAVTIPESEQDKALPRKLREELPGILAWAVRGCLAWQRDGLQAPAEVRSATAAYRSSMDVIGAFLDDCCVQGASYQVKARVLYDTYKAWCDEHNEYAETDRSFGSKLTDRGFQPHKSNSINWRLGVGLPDEQTQDRETLTVP